MACERTIAGNVVSDIVFMAGTNTGAESVAQATVFMAAESTVVVSVEFEMAAGRENAQKALRSWQE